MKRINVIKNGIITNSNRLSTEQECLDWLSSVQHHFGRQAQQLLDLPESPVPAELKAIATNIDEVELPDGSLVARYDVPAEFTHEIVDAQAEVDSEVALKFLQDTDFKVLRHVGQKALGIQTSMSEEAYLALEAQRQEARLKI